MVEHVTATLVTFPVAVPLPLATEQVCTGFVGCVKTVTMYAPPLGICVLKVNDVAPAAMVRLLVPLSCRTRPVPVRPEIVPPMVYVVVLQVTATFVTFPVAVPLPFVTEQVWVGFVGCVKTVTL